MATFEGWTKKSVDAFLKTRKDTNQQLRDAGAEIAEEHTKLEEKNQFLADTLKETIFDPQSSLSSQVPVILAAVAEMGKELTYAQAKDEIKDYAKLLSVGDKAAKANLLKLFKKVFDGSATAANNKRIRQVVKDADARRLLAAVSSTPAAPPTKAPKAPKPPGAGKAPAKDKIEAEPFIKLIGADLVGTPEIKVAIQKIKPSVLAQILEDVKGTQIGSSKRYRNFLASQRVPLEVKTDLLQDPKIKAKMGRGAQRHKLILDAAGAEYIIFDQPVKVVDGGFQDVAGKTHLVDNETLSWLIQEGKDTTKEQAEGVAKLFAGLTDGNQKLGKSVKAQAVEAHVGKVGRGLVPHGRARPTRTTAPKKVKKVKDAKIDTLSNPQRSEDADFVAMESGQSTQIPKQGGGQSLWAGYDNKPKPKSGLEVVYRKPWSDPYRMDATTGQFGNGIIDTEQLMNKGKLFFKNAATGKEMRKKVPLDLIDLITKKYSRARTYAPAAVGDFKRLVSMAEIPLKRTSGKARLIDSLRNQRQAAKASKNTPTVKTTGKVGGASYSASLTPTELMEKLALIRGSIGAGNSPNMLLERQGMDIIKELKKRNVITGEMATLLTQSIAR